MLQAGFVARVEVLRHCRDKVGHAGPLARPAIVDESEGMRAQISGLQTRSPYLGSSAN
jgi:hypothetical protein